MNRQNVEVLLNFLMVPVRVFLLLYDIFQFSSYVSFSIFKFSMLLYDSSADFCVDYKDVYLRNG